MGKLCWGLVVVLLLAGAGALWKFGVQGETEAAADGRLAVPLSAGGRDHVLREMRAFLQAAQQIIDAANRGDMTAVAQAARRVGMAATHDVPAELMRKLPLGMKKLGRDTHRRFDQLALDAEQLGDPGQVMGALADLMRNCVACHDAFRLTVAPAAP